MTRALIAILIVAVLGSCASPSGPARDPSGSPAPGPVAPGVTADPDELIAEAGRRLDAAAAQLESLQVAEARTELARAKDVLDRPELKADSDAEPLRARHATLIEQVPEAERQRQFLDAQAARTKLDSAHDALGSAVSALSVPEPDDSLFAVARACADAVDAALVSGQPFESQTPAYKERATLIRTELSVFRTRITERFAELLVARQPARVAEAEKRVAEALLAAKKADAGDSAIGDAETAVADATEVLRVGEPLAAKDAAYAKVAQRVGAQLVKAKATLAAERTRVAVKAQREKLDGTRQAVTIALGTLTSEAEADAAAVQVKAFLEVVAEAQGLEAQDQGYKRLADRARTDAESFTKKIEKTRVELRGRAQESSIADTLAKADADLAAVAAKSAPEAVIVECGATPPSVPVDPAELATAETAVTDAEKMLAEGEALADAGYRSRAAALRKRASALRVSIEARKIQRAALARERELLGAQQSLDACVATFEGESPRFDGAIMAIGALEAMLGKTPELLANEKKHAAFVAGVTKKLAAAKKAVDVAKVTAEGREHRRSVEAAVVAASEALSKLGMSTDHALYAAAEDAVAAVSSAIASGQELAAADRKHASFLKDVEKKVPSQRADIRRLRVEANKLVLAEKLGALAGEEPKESAFKDAEDALLALANVVEAAKTFAAKEKSLAAYSVASEREVAKARAEIDRRRDELVVGGHKKQLDTARATLDERMAQLQGDPDDAAFQAAETALSELESIVSAPPETKNAAHAKVLAAITKDIGSVRARIAKRRVEVEVARHAKQLDEKSSALAAAIAQLEGAPEPSAFDAAVAAASALEETIGTGGSAAEKDPKYKARLAAAGKGLERDRQRIEARRVEVDAGRIAARIDEASTAAGGAVEALAESSDASALDAAEALLGALEKAIEEGRAFQGEDRALAKSIADATRLGPKVKAKIEKLRVSAASASVASQLETARAEVKGAFEALVGKTEHSLYVAAEAAVAKLGEVAKSGSEAAENDGKLRRLLASLEAEILANRHEIRKRRIQANEDIAKARLEEIQDDSGFAPASEAVDALDTVIEAAKSFPSKDRKYLAEVATAERSAKALRAAIEARRVGLAVTAHQAKLAAAEEKVASRMATLASAESAESPSFQEADAALSELEGVLAEGADVAEKSGPFRKQLTEARASIEKNRKSIARRRVEVKVATHRTSVEAARAAFDEKVASLEGEPDAAAFDAATSAAQAVEDAIGAGAELGEQDSTYAKALAQAAKALSSDRARISKRRAEVALASARAALSGAVEEAKSAVAAGGQGLEPAEAALSKLDGAIASAAETAQTAKALTKDVGAARAQLAKLRNTLESAKVEAAVVAHRTSLEEAKAKASQALEALVGKTEHDLYVAAENAVAELKSTVGSGQELTERNSKYGKELAGAAAAVDEGRRQIRLRRIAATLEEAKQSIEAGKDPNELEAAVGRVDTVIEAAKSLSAKDKKYDGQLASFAKSVKGLRADIEKRRVDGIVGPHKERLEGARRKVEESLVALGAESDDAAFAAAEDAVKELESVLSDGAQAAEASVEHKKLIVRSSAELAKSLARIESRRVESRVARHRVELETAKAALAEKLEALRGDAPAFDDAEAAAKAVEDVIEKGDDASEKDPKYKKALGLAAKALAADRAKIGRRRLELEVDAERRKIEEASSAARAKAGEVGANPEPAAISAAEAAIGELEAALEGATHKGDKGLLKTIAAEAKTASKLRASVKDAQVASEVAAHESELAVAREKARQALEALVGKTEHDLYVSAENAVAELKASAQKGQELAAKSPKVRKALQAIASEVDAGRRQIRLCRIEATLDDARRAVAESTDANASEEAIGRVDTVIEAAKTFAAKDKKYTSEVAGYERSVKGLRAEVARKRVEAVVAPHKERMASAKAQLDERVGALSAKSDEAEIGAAEGAIRDFEAVISDGAAAAEESPAYKKELARATADIPKARARIKVMRAQAIVAGHRAQVESARAALSERISGLSGDEPAFDDAEAAVKGVEEVIDRGGEASEKDPKYKKELLAVRKSLGADRAKIARRKIELEIGKERSKIAAASEAARAASSSIDASSDPAALSAAETAIADLETALSESTHKKDKALVKVVGAEAKTVGKLRAVVAKARSDAVLAETSAKLVDAKQKVDAAFSALEGSTEHQRYVAAEDAVAALKSTVEGAGEAASGNAKLRSRLSTEQGAILRYREEIRLRRIKATQEEVETALANLESDPSDGNFTAAGEAVDQLDRVVEAGQAFASKDKKYLAKIVTSKKDAGKLRARIGARRARIAIDAHKQRFEPARDKAKEAMRATEVKDADLSLFATAEEALSELEGVIGEGEDAANQSAEYRKRLLGELKGINSSRALLKKRRAAAESAAEEAELSKLRGELARGLAGLKGDAPEEAFTAAEAALDAFDERLAKSDEVRDAKEKRRRAADLAAVKAARVKIAGRRTELEIARAARGLIEAGKAAQKSISRLKQSAEKEAIDAAESGISELEDALQTARTIAQSDKKLGKGLAKPLAKETSALKAAKAAVANTRASIETRERMQSVEAAQADVRSKLEALRGETEQDRYVAAENAIASFKSEVDRAASGVGKDAKAKKKLASLGALSGTYRQSMRLLRIDANTQRAKTEIATLDGGDASAFESANGAVDDLDQVIEAASMIGKGDRKYAAKLGAAKKTSKELRARIKSKEAIGLASGHRKEVEEATSKVASLMDALGEAGGVASAESAIKELDAVVKSGAQFAAKSAAYKKELAAVSKKAAAWRSELRAEQAKASQAELLSAESELKTSIRGARSEEELDAAGEALDGFAERVALAARAAKKDPKLKKSVAAMSKKVATYRASLSAKRSELSVAGHRDQLEAALSDVGEKLGALRGATEHQLYVDAENSIGSLKRVIEEGSEAGRRNKVYGKRLTKEAAKLAGYRAELRKIRVASNETVVKGRLEVYQSAPTPEGAERAREAIENLERVIESGRTFKAKDKKYGPYFAAAAKRAKGYAASLSKASRTIDTGEPSSEEPPPEAAPPPKPLSTKALKAALAVAKKRMGALKGKKPSKKAVAAAVEALEALDEAIAESDGLSKSKKGKAFYAKAKKTSKVYRATLERKRSKR
ncbi:MAG: hypothetical protein HYV07_03505 [Deltaproteobacteria bacterium]|nr:hypothetical protein [Deltaproteobacteria bacterium]